MARSTCDGSSVPEEHADPVETGQPFKVERDQQRLGLDAVEADVRGVGHAQRRVAVDDGARHAGQDAGFETVAQARDVARAGLQLRPGDAGGRFPAPRWPPRSRCPPGGGAPARPPVVAATRRRPRRTQSAPTPCGPLNLWADSDRRSTPRRSTSIGILPIDCTASVWNRAPCSCAIAASSASGWIVPISLLACMIDTRAVAGVSAASSVSGDTMPRLSTGSSVVLQPRRASAFRVLRTASCSMALATSCRRAPAASATPRIARLSASVPPLVKMISCGRAPIRSANRAARDVEPGLRRLSERVYARRVAELAAQDRDGGLEHRRLERRRRIVVEVHVHSPILPSGTLAPVRRRGLLDRIGRLSVYCKVCARMAAVAQNRSPDGRDVEARGGQWLF